MTMPPHASPLSVLRTTADDRLATAQATVKLLQKPGLHAGAAVSCPTHKLTCHRNCTARLLQKGFVALQVAGTDNDWFVYKAVRGPAAAGNAAEALLSDTVNVGRHTITEVGIQQ